LIAGDIIKEGLYRITDMVEKPPKDQAPPNLAIIGRYILTPDIFDILSTPSPARAVRSRLPMRCWNRRVTAACWPTSSRAGVSTAAALMASVEATNYVYENVYRQPEKG